MKPVRKTPWVLLLALLIAPFTRAEGINFEHLSLDEAFVKAKKENKDIFVDVYATWCGPCKYLTNSVFTDPALGTYMNENYICIKIDGEQMDGEQLDADFGIDAYPTMLFISPENILKKRIVGAVEADKIMHTAKGVKNPESTALFQLQTKYDDGNRDRDMMIQLISERMNEDMDAIPLALEFIELYPNLNLENEDDFLVFYLGSDAIDDVLVIEFLANTAKYSELHPNLARQKMDAILGNVALDAIKNDDRKSIETGVDKLYDSYALIQGDEAYEKEEVKLILLEYFDESSAE